MFLGFVCFLFLRLMSINTNASEKSPYHPKRTHYKQVERCRRHDVDRRNGLCQNIVLSFRAREFFSTSTHTLYTTRYTFYTHAHIRIYIVHGFQFSVSGNVTNEL